MKGPALVVQNQGEGIREAGRSTQGVKRINLQAGDIIGSIERIAKIEDAEDAGKAAASPPPAPK